MAKTTATAVAKTAATTVAKTTDTTVAKNDHTAAAVTDKKKPRLELTAEQVKRAQAATAMPAARSFGDAVRVFCHAALHCVVYLPFTLAASLLAFDDYVPMYRPYAERLLIDLKAITWVDYGLFILTAVMSLFFLLFTFMRDEKDGRYTPLLAFMASIPSKMAAFPFIFLMLAIALPFIALAVGIPTAIFVFGFQLFEDLVLMALRSSGAADYLRYPGQDLVLSIVTGLAICYFFAPNIGRFYSLLTGRDHEQAIISAVQKVDRWFHVPLSFMLGLWCVGVFAVLVNTDLVQTLSATLAVYEFSEPMPPLVFGFVLHLVVGMTLLVSCYAGRRLYYLRQQAQEAIFAPIDDNAAKTAEPLFRLQVAGRDDIELLGRLFTRSYRALMASHYDREVLDQALDVITRANPDLLASGRFYLVEDTRTGALAGCGGWSDKAPGAPAETAEGRAHLRHFAVHPDNQRQGVGRLLVAHCLKEAKAAGMREMHCLSSLNAERFYAAMGFETLARLDTQLPGDIPFPSILMRRAL